MLAKDALDILALRPGATAVEIKEAYRDMVKVWHPDRFGSDPRLRQKAEEKLQQINKAYQVLVSGPETGQSFAAEPERNANSTVGDAPSSRGPAFSPNSQSGRASLRRSSVGVGWLYAGVGIALGLFVGYVALEHGSGQGAAIPPPASVQPGEASGEPAAAKIPAMPTPRVAAEREVGSTKLPGRDVAPKDAVRRSRSTAAQFRVRQLSGAETDQLESACSKLKDTAYRTCIRAQLDMITNAPGQPDLSALNGGERESIESACSEAKRLHGAGGNNRCLTSQMAEFAANPARPDLSGLSEADRSSIEAACRKAKYRDGPSAYNRCRIGLIKLLAESK